MWHLHDAAALPQGIAVCNGRLEAIQVDVATKFAGRIAEILLDEGDRRPAGQVVARMDTTACRRSYARPRRRSTGRAPSSRRSTWSRERQTAKATADALVPERRASSPSRSEQFDRSRALLATGAVPQQQLDLDKSKLDGTSAELAAAKSQVDEARTAIDVARSQVLGAESSLQAAVATTERIKSDLAESELEAPRPGRVQHRLAQPGEVLGEGGRFSRLIDLTDVYMTVFLPETVAGSLAVGGEARLVLDASPMLRDPRARLVCRVRGAVHPEDRRDLNERQKLVFEVKVHIDPDLLDEATGRS